MNRRRWVLPLLLGISVLVLARGCYGNWLFGIVESFGTPNGAKITTIAGTGAAGSSGDGGPATSAQLNQPSGVAVDSAGNLYIADTNNGLIRKIDTTGKITTVATLGPGVNPNTVAVDSSGNLFFDDSNHNEIGKVTPGGAISVFAGTGARGSTGDNGLATSALLNFPTGVAVDVAGNVYIADFYNSVIRKVTIDGIIHRVAGSYYAGYTGDGQIATTAELNFPYGVIVDSSGSLYVADTTNAVIRKVTPGGTISTVAGNSIVGYSGDGASATSASVNLPTTLAIDQAGNLYIADRNNNIIRKVAADGTITTVAGNWHLLTLA